jgi:uroporphyrinogen-III decarboxylase
MSTLYKIISSDDYVETTAEAVRRHELRMRDALSNPDYTCDIQSSLTDESSDIALAIETPDALWKAVCDDKSQTWSDAEAVAEAMGYELQFDSNKRGSWNYQFVKV